MKPGRTKTAGNSLRIADRRTDVDVHNDTLLNKKSEGPYEHSDCKGEKKDRLFRILF